MVNFSEKSVKAGTPKLSPAHLQPTSNISAKFQEIWCVPVIVILNHSLSGVSGNFGHKKHFMNFSGKSVKAGAPKLSAAHLQPTSNISAKFQEIWHVPVIVSLNHSLSGVSGNFEHKKHFMNFSEKSV